MSDRTAPSSPATLRQRRAAIYRRAAKRMEALDLNAPTGQLFNYGYACNAIQAVLGRDPLAADAKVTKAFKSAFSPGWANEYGFFGPMEKQTNRNRRIVALCFAAAMAERGDL